MIQLAKLLYAQLQRNNPSAKDFDSLPEHVKNHLIHACEHYHNTTVSALDPADQPPPEPPVS